MRILLIEYKFISEVDQLVTNVNEKFEQHLFFNVLEKHETLFHLNTIKTKLLEERKNIIVWLIYV